MRMVVFEDVFAEIKMTGGHRSGRKGHWLLRPTQLWSLSGAAAARLGRHGARRTPLPAHRRLLCQVHPGLAPRRHPSVATTPQALMHGRRLRRRLTELP